MKGEVHNRYVHAVENLIKAKNPTPEELQKIRDDLNPWFMLDEHGQETKLADARREFSGDMTEEQKRRALQESIPTGVSFHHEKEQAPPPTEEEETEFDIAHKKRLDAIHRLRKQLQKHRGK